MIGAVELRGGLYHLSTHSVSYISISVLSSLQSAGINSVHITDFNVWHARLGHLSYNKMSIMHKVYPFIKTVGSHSPCDVCHYSKQKKLPFPNSISNSVNCFDLIHMDVWGPIAWPSIFGHIYFPIVVDDKSRHT